MLLRNFHPSNYVDNPYCSELWGQPVARKGDSPRLKHVFAVGILDLSIRKSPSPVPRLAIRVAESANFLSRIRETLKPHGLPGSRGEFLSG